MIFAPHPIADPKSGASFLRKNFQNRPVIAGAKQNFLIDFFLKRWNRTIMKSEFS